MRYILRYGYAKLTQLDENGQPLECEVLDYITQELAADDVVLSHPLYARLLSEACQIDRELARQYGDMKQEQSLPRLREALQVQLDEIHSKEEVDEKLLKMAEERFLAACEAVRYEAEISYIGHTYINSPDMELSSQAIELMSDRHQLSKIHTKYQVVERDIDRLNELIPRAVFELKDAIIMRRIAGLRGVLRDMQAHHAEDQMINVLEEIAHYMEVRKNLAVYLGERIVPAKTK